MPQQPRNLPTDSLITTCEHLLLLSAVSTSPLAALFIRPCSRARFGERRLGSPVRGALGEAGMSLPVQVWPVQSLASRTEASPAGVTVTGRPKRGSGLMGCGIDSRN